MTGQEYRDFLASKQPRVLETGKHIATDAVHPTLFPHQKALVQWAVRKGTCALWADTGLGKSRMSLEWARLSGEKTLMVAPLGVARQTVHEAERIGLHIRYARQQREATEAISITNYEMLEHFDAAAFGAVVLDESSILKSVSGATRRAVTEMFSATRYKLCCTATPAPNDITELANHAEFLGIMRRVDMLAAFFVHDDEGWRLKGHAQQPFYRWLASWAMAIRKPSDLGFDDAGYDLPPLSILPQWVDVDVPLDGQLFFTGLKGITDRTHIRRSTLQARVDSAVDLVASQPDEPWLLWCGLNEESAALAARIPGAVEVVGSESPESKADKLEAFQAGQIQTLVSKSRIFGFGTNLQHCARMAFVGLGDSYEQYYQCIRRCWRFGQARPVQVYVVLSRMEDGIFHNVLRKEEEADAMSARLVDAVRSFERAEMGQGQAMAEYCPAVQMTLPAWLAA